MRSLLPLILKRLLSIGNLRVTTANGTTFKCGDGTGAPVAVHFTSNSALWSVLLDPELKLGEAYMEGSLVVDSGTIADVLSVLLAQPTASKPKYWMRLGWMFRYLFRRFDQFNTPSHSRRNVAHHYDLDDSLYSLFLDADRQYSCAYFESPDQSLEDAQLAKKRHLAAKLLLKSSHRILDIGCGWGGLALYLADYCRTHVTGITLSERQLTVALARAANQRLANRADFRLVDFRHLRETFDRIVSVGMFEHVGVGFYDAFFRKCASLLADDGVMVISSTGRSDGPNATSPWISKYIFPGGYIPALSEVLPAIERSGLLVTDIEILRLHYADTLRLWQRRFLAHRDSVERLYGERFFRMWEFYLAASEMAFRKQAIMVFQIQLAKRQDVVPMSRSYIEQESLRLRTAERRERPPMVLAKG